MAYNIGQFRYSSNTSFSTALSMTLDYQISEDTVGGGLDFKNPYGILQGDNILNNQNCYYLKFGVKKLPSVQNFYLKLRNSTETEDNEQLIDEFKVDALKAGEENEIVYFETIISPNSVYNQIVWELRRIPMDYSSPNPDGTQGRVMIVTGDFTYTRLTDLLASSIIITNNGYLTKIGVQGPPSLLMCINREQIRIGKTGIYELNNQNIRITSISFVPKSDSDYFIMDYEY